MTRYWFVIGLIVLVGAGAQAQELQDIRPGTLDCLILADDDAGGRYPDRALEFEMDNYFRLSSFEGLDIAYRVQTSESRGWRFGTNFNFRVNNQNSSGQYGDEDPSSTDSDERNISLRLLAQKLFITRPSHSASFYWGLGPVASYGWSKSTNDNTSDHSSESKSTRWTAGLNADLGVVWRLIDQLSLEARYRWFAGYSSNENSRTYWLESEVDHTNRSESNAFELDGSNSVDLALAFHF